MSQPAPSAEQVMGELQALRQMMQAQQQQHNQELERLRQENLMAIQQAQQAQQAVVQSQTMATAIKEMTEALKSSKSSDVPKLCLVDTKDWESQQVSQENLNSSLHGSTAPVRTSVPSILSFEKPWNGQKNKKMLLQKTSLMQPMAMEQMRLTRLKTSERRTES
jgi:hypothetical protein